MTGFWLSVGLEGTALIVLVATALWALSDADHVRQRWQAERKRRVSGSNACTCGAYRRC